MTITIATTEKRQVVDITDKITREVIDFTGFVSIFAMHSTVGITTANLDPGTDLDLLDAVGRMLPDLQWRHPHNPAHTADHILASIIGPALVVPVQNGQLQLGTWQRIVLVDFNGPQERQVAVGLVSGQSTDPNLVL